jgi:hypothetical protein
MPKNTVGIMLKPGTPAMLGESLGVPSMTVRAVIECFAKHLYGALRVIRLAKQGEYANWSTSVSTLNK